MPSATDIIRRNVERQVALNSGQIAIASVGGSYQFVDTATGQPLEVGNDVGNYALSQAPAVYQSALRAEIYNYAKGLFGGKDVPPELIEVLATMATYYSANTGTPVTDLFARGVLLEDFMNTVNNLRNRTSQIGYAGLNLEPHWTTNITLRASIAKALQPWNAIGITTNRDRYDKEPVGFTFYDKTDNLVYIMTANGWEQYTDYEPLWPA